MIGQTVGHYQIIEEIGRGAMGVVYRAEDTQLQCFRALKFLTADGLGDREVRERFLAEARTLASVQHPNICPVHEIGEHEDQVFIVMSLLEGQTLEGLLAAGPLPEKRILSITRDIARGLEKAHKSGVVHRDIKPANIMITDDGHAVIMDFGVAKQKASLLKTRTGTLMGTLAYLAPEMLQGEEVGPGADLWSLGVVLYEMLSGHRPFSGDYEAAVMFAISNSEHEPLGSSVQPGWSTLVDRLLEKDPVARYQDADSLLESFDQFERGEISAVSSRSAGKSQGLPRWIMFGTPALALVVVLTVAVMRFFPQGGSTYPLTSIAVLPLAERQGGQEDDFFAWGMTDELSTTLAGIDQLSVVSQRSAARAAEQYEDSLQELGNHLQVGAILEGTVQKAGNRVRVFAQLVQTSDGKVLWTDSFDGEISDVLTLQSALARAIADAVVVNLSLENQNFLASSQKVDPVAYELVLKGRYLKEKYGQETLWEALEVFKQATMKDRAYAVAYAEVAGVIQVLAQGHSAKPYPGGFQAAYSHSKAYLDTALSLDSNLAQAHAYRAMEASYFAWDWETAEKQYLRAVDLNPGLSQAWDELGTLYSVFGRHEEAVAALKKAVQIDPMVAMRVADLGMVLGHAGRLEAAAAQFQVARDLEPGFLGARTTLAEIYLGVGRCREAQRIYEEITEDTENFDGLSLPWLMAAALACQGETARAEALLEEPSPLQDIFPYGKLYALGFLGRVDEAIDFAYQLKEERNPWLPMILTIKACAPLYSDPRMEELCRELGVPVPGWAQ